MYAGNFRRRSSATRFLVCMTHSSPTRMRYSSPKRSSDAVLYDLPDLASIGNIFGLILLSFDMIGE